MQRLVQLANVVLITSVWSFGTAVGAAPALDAIERQITKEPAYDWLPIYCLLAIGPEANTLVWMVEDGEKLYIDKNANGDMTDDGPPLAPTNERTWQRTVEPETQSRHFEYILSEFSPANGSTQKNFKLIRWNYGESTNDCYALSLTLDGKVPMYAGWFGSFWGASPGEASIVHFGAPLTPTMLRYKNFALGSGLRRLSVGFFAPGLGDGSESRLNIEAVAADVVPVLEIEWPTANGGPPLRTTHRLDQRCCYWEFYTTEFEVPAEAGIGTAKISIELPDGSMPLPLTTTTLEVPVVAAE